MEILPLVAMACPGARRVGARSPRARPHRVLLVWAMACHQALDASDGGALCGLLSSECFKNIL